MPSMLMFYHLPFWFSSQSRGAQIVGSHREDIDLSLLTILSSAPGPLPPLALRLAVQMDLQISGASDKVPAVGGRCVFCFKVAEANLTSSSIFGSYDSYEQPTIFKQWFFVQRLHKIWRENEVDMSSQSNENSDCATTLPRKPSYNLFF